VLSVLPPGSNPGPEVRPSGLIFTGLAGESPGSQDVRIGNPTGDPTEFVSGMIGTGFTFAPSAALVQPSQPTTFRVYPDFDDLTAGTIYRGTITLQFADGTPRTISVLTVVAPAGTRLTGAGPAGAERAATGCTPSKLLPVFAQLGSGPTVTAGFPATVSVKVVDDCGSPITSGSVVASFSNGDIPISLVSLQDGNWTNSWQPRGGSANTVAITVDAQVPELNLRGIVQASLGLQAARTLPVLSGGPVHGVKLSEGPLAPGDLILLKGASLANGKSAASPGSATQQLAGASLVIGGRLANLLYADSTQVLGLVPTDLPLNTAQQVVIQRDNDLGVPAPVIISAANPAVIAKDASGQGQGMIYKAVSGNVTTLADAANPVKSGETILIYCTGLGLTDQNGVASNPPTVFIGGKQAEVSYAGVALTKNYPQAGAPTLLGGLASAAVGGLYQITAVVPAGLANGPAAVMVTAAGQSSQTGVTVAITGGAAGSGPAITSINTAGGFPDIAQNTFIEIKGMNLAPASVGAGTTWTGAPEFDMGRMPTQLGGVSVTVNGKAAFVYFISPGQLNVLTPIESATGLVQVVVTSGGVSSAPFNAQLRAAAPSLLRFDAAHVVATHADYTLLGPESLSAPGFLFTPARPGEIITLFAVGFGLPATSLVNGSSSQFGELPVKPACQIGNAPAAVAFAGVISPGLYQLNLTVPASAANGDNSIGCAYSGFSTPAGGLLAVQR
jgi:uncharacterized protein (TIGR03437 family)